MWVDWGEQARPSALSQQAGALSSRWGQRGTREGDSEGAGQSLGAAVSDFRISQPIPGWWNIPAGGLGAGEPGGGHSSLLTWKSPEGNLITSCRGRGGRWRSLRSPPRTEILKGLGLLLCPQRLGSCLMMGKGWA